MGPATQGQGGQAVCREPATHGSHATQYWVATNAGGKGLAGDPIAVVSFVLHQNLTLPAKVSAARNPHLHACPVPTSGACGSNQKEEDAYILGDEQRSYCSQTNPGSLPP